MNLYTAYLEEIEIRKAQALKPKPIDHGPMVEQLISQIIDNENPYRKESLEFFIYNIIHLLTLLLFKIFAGLPNTVVFFSTFFVTKAPAPIIAFSPITIVLSVVPCLIIATVPTYTLSLITILPLHLTAGANVT